MLRKLLIFFIILTSCRVGNSQNEAYELPVYYGLFFNDPQINTLGFNNNSDIRLSVAHRRNSNNFGGINTSLFSGQFKLKSKNEKAYSTIGGQVVSDKEGFLIRRNRTSLNYGRHLKMNKKFNIAGGFSAGFYNFSIVSNDVTGSYSDYAFDGSFSLALYNEKTKVGLNINQFANPKIRPIAQEVVLARHLNIFFSQQFNLGEEVKFIPNLITRYSKSSRSVFSGFTGSLAGSFLFNNSFIAGVSIEKSNGYYFYGGVNQINILKSLLDINLSYFVPSGSNQRSNVQLFEVYVICSIKTKKK